MKKLILGLAGLSLLVGPGVAFAETSTKVEDKARLRTAQTITLNQTCVAGAVDTLTSSLKSAVDTHATAVKNAMDKRGVDLKAAFVKTGNDRRTALKQARKDFRTAVSAARKIRDQAGKTAREQFKTTMKMCGATSADTGVAATSVQDIE